MTALDFLVEMPRLCGCKNAERKATIIKWIYERELAGDSVFDRADNDRADPYLRAEPIAALLYGDDAADFGAIDQCMRIVHIIEWNHYLEEHGEDYYKPFIDDEYKAVEEHESEYPDITDVVSAYEALTWHWAD